MNRRGFIQAILATGIAPAFIGASVLMPVRRIIAPDTRIVPALDDYEEGLWIPTMSGPARLMPISGRYTRIGKVITFTGTVTFPQSNKAQMASFSLIKKQARVEEAIHVIRALKLPEEG